ncbi:MAG: rhodanese-like domain-containing protein [Rhodoferax sp.]|nr:MAG: rhodanese-like domain-containing protein [Rhodoferax sp.]
MTNLDFSQLLQEYWPLVLLVAWFGHKWLRARRVVALLPSLRQQGAVLLDVRSAAEFASGNAPGTRNIPLSELAARLGELPRNVPVVVCCASGTRSGMAALLLKKNGFVPVYNAGSWTALNA